MAEHSRVQWAEDFLENAHAALNRAAVDGRLCDRANDARFAIGQALTAAEQRTHEGDPVRWSKTMIETVNRAGALLAAAKHSPEAERAAQLCAQAARLLGEAGKLKPEFAARGADQEAPMRFFGNARVANGGKGHGVPLAKPIAAREVDTSQDAERVNEQPSSWKARAQSLQQGSSRARRNGRRRGF